MRLVTASLLALFALAGSAPAQEGDPLRQTPGVPPPGANDFGCRSTAHPVPVILVHGTFGDMTVSWNSLAPQLVRDGYCVFALDLVRRGTAPIDESADKLAEFAREVLRRTGAAKVSYVGHSQGGMLARYVAKSRGLLEQADDIIGLAPSSHGTTSPGADPAARFFDCPACAEQKAGSDFMAKVNTPPEAPAPAHYTVISTRYDEVVTPVASQALAGESVTNVVVQDRCPADLAEHVDMVHDPVALQWVRDALGRPGPASHAFVPSCGGLTARRGPATGGGDRPATGGELGADDRGARRVEVSRKPRRLTRRGTAPVVVKCVGDRACRGTLEVRADGRRLGRAAWIVPAGLKRAVAVRLDARARRLVRRSGHVHLTGRAVHALEGGVAQIVRTRFVLRG